MKTRFLNRLFRFSILNLLLVVFCWGFYDIAFADTGKVNLIANSSFEVGVGHGWGRFLNVSCPLNESMLDTLEPIHGKYCLKLPHDPQGSFPQSLIYKYITLEPGKTYTLSFYARAEKKGTKVEFGLYPAGDESIRRIFKKGVILDSKWKRYSVTGVAGETNLNCYSPQVRITNWADSSYILFDAFQCAEGQLRNYQPAHTIEIGYVTEKLGHIFEPGKVNFEVWIYNNSKRELRESHRYRILDYWGKEVCAKSFVVKSEPGQTRMSLHIPLRESGAYRLLSYRQEEKNPESEVVFSVLPLPRYPNQLRPESPFGVHLNFQSEYLMRLAQRIGIKWLRTHDSTRFIPWYGAEPKQGRWVFDNEIFKKARKYGFCILGTLTGVPKWARSGPSWTDPPKDLTLWDDYVKTIVSHYRDYIDAWEILNEAYGTQEDWRIAYYRDLLKRTYPVIKKLDPDSTVVGLCTLINTKKWTEQILKTSAKYMDVVSFHFYAISYDRFRRENYPILSKLKVNLPLWNTEGGIANAPFYRTLHNANKGYWYDKFKLVGLKDYKATNDRSIRLYLNALVDPRIQKVFWYWMNLDSTPTILNFLNLTEYDGSLRPAAVGIATMAYLLEGTKPVKKLSIPDSKIQLRTVFKGKSRGVIVLCGRDKLLRGYMEVEFVPKGIQFYNVMGGSVKTTRDKSGKQVIPLSADPLYIVADNPELIDKMGRLVEKASFHWKYIHLKRKSSIVMPKEFFKEDTINSGSFLRKWCVLGPFDSGSIIYGNTKVPGYDIKFPPEHAVNLGAKYHDRWGREISWQYAESDKGGKLDGRVNLVALLMPNEHVVGYAYTDIISPQDQNVKIGFGSDDAAKVWINGKEAFQIYVFRGSEPDQNTFLAKLQKGKNTVLVKVLNELGGWDFYFRFLKLEKAIRCRVPTIPQTR